MRALKPEAQLREVAARYRLAARARPFTLCLRCNLRLEQAAILAAYEVFSRCGGCGRVYWPGSHYERMMAALARGVRWES